MEPKRIILIFIYAVFIICFNACKNDNPQPFQYEPLPATQIQQPSESLHISYDLNNSQPIDRSEALNKSLKRYREHTYWGNEHSIDEKIKDFDDDEFKMFIKEIEMNDADVYWGVEY